MFGALSVALSRFFYLAGWLQELPHGDHFE